MAGEARRSAQTWPPPPALEDDSSELRGPYISPLSYDWVQAGQALGDVDDPGGAENGAGVAEDGDSLQEDERSTKFVAAAASPAQPSKVHVRSSRTSGIGLRGTTISSRLSSLAPLVSQQVRFRDLDTRKTATLRIGFACGAWVLDLMLRWLEVIESYWMAFRRPLIVGSGLFELWSMGVWLGFLTEPKMADSLRFIAIIDMVCNFLYIIDSLLSIGQFYAEERRRRRAMEEDLKGHKSRRFSAQDRDSVSEEVQRRPEGPKEAGEGLLQNLFTSNQTQLKVYFGLLLATGMVPVQFLLYDILSNQRYVIWQVIAVLVFRFCRVVWGFRSCANMINQQELEVYVDIRMHGASGSSWNRARILAKQFLIVAFFGHWFGCISYGVRRMGGVVQTNIRVHPDTTRDYFEEFKDQGNIGFEVGEQFWQSYLLALYKGFNLNIEDMLPERPMELLLEATISMMILLMKSYCIGSFFKYHQKREMEVQRFRQLMVSVTQYLDLYEVPPSLRKAVVNHFRFQQANHRKIQTLEVIGRLPVEVQKKLREQEVLPTVVDRNHALFGTGLSRDFCLQIAVALSQRFLQPSEVIFMELEVPRELVFLESGAVALSRGTAAEGQRTEQLLRYVRADRKDDPTALGAVSLILGALHFYSARVRAGTEAVTLNLPRKEFEDLRGSFHEQYDQLIRNIQETYGVDGDGHNAGDDHERFAMAQCVEIRKTLQTRQDSINATFTYAASKGDVKLVQELLRKRMDPNVADYDKRSALHLAASEGMSDVLEALLEANGDPNCLDRWGSTPMQDALKCGYVGAAKIVQKHGGRLELADPAGVICTYASEGNTLGMQQLIDFRVDPNSGDYDSRTALHLSSAEGHLPVVTFLTMRKADVNSKDRWKSTPIQDAIRNGFATVASHLRAQGGRVDSDFVANQLCDAASTGDLPMLKMLYETGVDVNQGDYDARTALHLAAAEGQVLALNFLVNTAQALHSPVDRWGATPLQDALTGGHSVCVQVLLSCGAGLGPSADRVARQTVEKLATEMGFRNGGIAAFSEASGKLRRRLRAHMLLVEQKKARADIFNMEEAQKFNMQVVIASFGKMQGLREEARWMIALLQQLEPASQCTWQLLRLLRDAVSLLKEAKLWGEASLILEGGGGKKRKKKHRSKDASDMAFHHAFLASTRFVPMLQDVMSNTTARVLAKVRTMEKAALRNSYMDAPSMMMNDDPQRPSSVAALVVGELFSELGWGGLERLQPGRYAASEGVAAKAEDVGITSHNLISRLEDQARLLLPAEHLTWTLLSGPLRLHGSGVSTTGGFSLGKSPAFHSLRTWLEQRSNLVLAGKPVKPGQPPIVSHGAKPQEIFGSLWPTRRHSEGQQPRATVAHNASGGGMTATPSAGPRHFPAQRGAPAAGKAAVSAVAKTSSMGRRPSLGSSPRVVRVGQQASSPQPEMSLEESEAMSNLVATELVLMALAALVMEGWDRGARLPNKTEEDEEDQQAMKRLLKTRSKSNHSLDDADTKLVPEDFQELGFVFRRAARACRGMQDEAQKLAKKAAKIQTAWDRDNMDAEMSGDTGGNATERRHGVQRQNSDDEDGYEALERRPIRLAKILALQEKMSVDELAILMDVDDCHNQDEGKVRAFGELSRERFVMNLMRCILDYDATHIEVMSMVRASQLMTDTVVEQRLIDEAKVQVKEITEDDLVPTPTQTQGGTWHPRTLVSKKTIQTMSEIYAEVDRLHEVLSDGGGAEQVDVVWNDAASERRGPKASQATMGGDADDARSTGVWWWQRGPNTRSALPVDRGGSFRKAVSTISSGSSTNRSARSGRGSEGVQSLTGRTSSRSRRRNRCARRVKSAVKFLVQFFGAEGRQRRKRQRIAKRFKELDDDGEGIGTSEVAQLLAVAYRHTLGAEGELRWAYRVFELLNKADVGDLVTLPEFLSVLPKLTEEIKAQQRKNQNRRDVSSTDAAIGPIARFASGLVITPESPFVYIWDQVRKMVVIYYMFEVPMRFCFLSRDKLTHWASVAHLAASIFADLFMGLNVFLTFFRAFVHPTLGVISAFQDIRMHYLLSLFPVDLVACAPVDWWLPEDNGNRGLLARPRAFSRLLKLLHLHHLRHVETGSMEASWGFAREAVSMSLSVFTLTHFLACVWWLLGTRYDDFDPYSAFNETVAYAPPEGGNGVRGSWTFSYLHRPGESPIGSWDGDTPYWWQYLVSYYWTVGRITSQSSSGNLTAASWLELAWMCGMFFLNVAVNGYCDGILVDKVIAGDEQFIEAEAMRRILDEYLHTAELPAELTHEVRSSAALSDKMVAWQRMEDTIAALPHSLRQRVARRTVVMRLTAQGIFKPCSESFLVELGTHCRILPVGRGQVLARPGEPASQLAILNFGRVAAQDAQGTTLAETSSLGDMIEEMPFIFNLKHNVLITVMEDTQLVVLGRLGFTEACKMYPDDSMTLRRSAMKAVQAFAEEFGEEVRADDDAKSRAGATNAKSTLSFNTSTSRTSRQSSNAGLSEFLRRGYVRELKLVAEKLREEETAARQDIICNFIQKASDGDVAGVSAMISKGEVFVDEGDYDQRTALHLAVCNGHIEVVKALIENFNASIHVKDRFDHTPIEDAVREKKVEILRYLVGRGAQYQADTNVAAQLCQAAHDNDLDTLRLLLDIVGVSANSGDYDKRTALHLGASEGHLAVVELLVNSQGIDMSPLDRLGNTPLDDAMRHKHVQVRRYLHSKGARMGDRNMGVALCSLAAAEDVEGLRELADSEVSLGQGDYDARTALHLASSEDRLTAATYLLLEANVDPNPLDRFLSTPLDDAIRHKHTAMEALLRAKGGLMGSDPVMQSAVTTFREEKVVQEAQMVKRRLEKEVQNSEVSTIMASLKRFREHPTMEDDVHAFVTHSANFRDLILRLLAWSTRPPETSEWVAANGLATEASHTTKVYREQLLERTCAELEGSLGRLVTVLDTEVLPWLANLSKAEARLLRVLVPDLKPAVSRILEQLRGGARVRKFVRHLWSDKAAGGGAYQCLPVGLLLQKEDAELAHRVRLEAEALLWATGASAGQKFGEAGRRRAQTASYRAHSQNQLP